MRTNAVIDNRKLGYLASLLSVKGITGDRDSTVLKYLADHAKWKGLGASQFALTTSFVDKACIALDITENELRTAIDGYVAACLLIPVKGGAYMLNPEFFGLYDWNTVTDISYGVSEGINFPYPYIGVRLIAETAAM